jgi:hypothetical protein
MRSRFEGGGGGPGLHPQLGVRGVAGAPAVVVIVVVPPVAGDFAAVAGPVRGPGSVGLPRHRPGLGGGGENWRERAELCGGVRPAARGGVVVANAQHRRHRRAHAPAAPASGQNGYGR